VRAARASANQCAVPGRRAPAILNIWEREFNRLLDGLPADIKAACRPFFRLLGHAWRREVGCLQDPDTIHSC
jgi:hypothetical protein